MPTARDHRTSPSTMKNRISRPVLLLWLSLAWLIRTFELVGLCRRAVIPTTQCSFTGLGSKSRMFLEARSVSGFFSFTILLLAEALMVRGLLGLALRHPAGFFGYAEMPMFFGWLATDGMAALCS